jgi:hypothetical protein
MGELSTMTTRAMSVSTVLSSFTKFPSFITHDARKNLQHDAIYSRRCANPLCAPPGSFSEARQNRRRVMHERT